jgi:hypothetical protein
MRVVKLNLAKCAHKALHHVPRLLFAPFVCKQVMDIAGANSRLSKHEPSHSPLCPSCLDCIETCGHVLTCEQEDRVKCFLMSADNLEKWLRSVGTDPTLEECIMVFVRSRDAQSFSHIKSHHRKSGNGANVMLASMIPF